MLYVTLTSLFDYANTQEFLDTPQHESVIG